MRTLRAHTLAYSGGDPAAPGREHDTRHGPVRVVSTGGAQGKGWLGAVRHVSAEEGLGAERGSLAGGTVWWRRPRLWRGEGVFVATVKQRGRARLA